MDTFILSPENANYPLKSLVERVVTGDIQICDASGKILAYVTSPAGREDMLYAEAAAEAREHLDLLRKRSQSREWITTEELCRRVGMPYHGNPVKDQ